MALLDRFRAQPGQKHPDAAVRLAFVQEIPISERELLAEIARDDAEARVRKAAAAKLMDPVALAGVARTDADDSVRAQALTMLRDIALEQFEGVGETDGLAAVDALASLPDAKALAVVAKTSAREAVAQRALGHVTEQHALGSIARHAAHESARLAAFGALQDHEEILSVAINTEFKDPTLAAVERISDAGELEQIASRAKNRSASKRARAILREREEAAARAAAEAKEASDAAAASEAAARRAAHDEADARERQVREDAEREIAERARAEDAERNRAAEEASSRAREEQQAAEQAHRAADEEAARKEAERKRARLSELFDEAVKAAAIEDIAEARRQFAIVRREWQALGGGAAADPAVAERYAALDAAYTAKDTAAREADQRIRKEALARLQQQVARLEPIAPRDDLTLKVGERALKDIRTALSSIPQLPSKRDFDEIVRRFKAAQAALMPKVQELRDVADWQRWANVGIQEQLCEKMEALRAIDDPEEIARQVRDLQARWRESADVPRAQGDALWKRFKAAHDEVWKKCESHFAAQAEERAQNLAKKIALCERAEALAESTQWIQTADEIKKLQAEWKTIGPVSRGQEKAIWERFRVPCDRFFSRRHADLAERKGVWAENLAKKEALIAKAEAISQSSDWEPAASEIRRVQGEGKNVGPVKKSRSEPLWQRFRAACDTFFTRYASRHDVAREERVAAREAIVAELEALVSADATEPPADLAVKVRDIRARYNGEIAQRGVDREHAQALDDRFAAAFKGVIARWPAAFAGTELDPEANRKRMESLVQRMEELAKSLGSSLPSAGAALSPTTKLAAMLRDALAANTIGGKVDDTARLRAASDEVRQAQTSWSRIGYVPEEVRRSLSDRFARAARAVAERSGGPGAARPARPA